jgi:hypothetical protein
MPAAAGFQQAAQKRLALSWGSKEGASAMKIKGAKVSEAWPTEQGGVHISFLYFLLKGGVRESNRARGKEEKQGEGGKGMQLS